MMIYSYVQQTQELSSQEGLTQSKDTDVQYLHCVAA